ncbi:MAG: TIGR04222 domain-containing membrane protein [Candidatus Obscuribacterales bacterium]|nr:TIGR04222 domain-containing membrane protein [Cyanobacteria bacterium SZAS LIN-5]
MNEFDLMGPQFLAMYVPATFGAIFGAIVLRYALKIKGGEYNEVDLSPYDAAYLSGGDTRVVDAAAAKLLASGVFTSELTERTIKASGILPSDADPVERSVFQAVRNHYISKVRDIYKYVVPISGGIRPKLVDAGLILGDARIAAIRSLCTLTVLCPVVFLGIPKLLLGLSRGKPIGILMVLILIGLLTALWFFCQSYARTARGDAALSYLQAENRALEYSVKYGSTPTGTELAMATGLFGTTILLTSPLFATMKPLFITQRSGSGCGSSSSGCGSSCGGGGCGGGCGGCGG